MIITTQTALILASVLLFSCQDSFAATYYIDAHGSDRSGNGSETRPWQTLQYAADRVNAGDTVYVLDGTYAPFHITRDGKAQQRIIFKAKGEKITIKGTEWFSGRYSAVSILASYITLDGFIIQVDAIDRSIKSRGIRVSGDPDHYVHDVHIIGNQVANAGWVGITTSYAKNVLIERNRIWGSKDQHGIYVANSADKPVIRDNVSFENRQAGIQINADPLLPGDGIISGAVISGNILYQNGKGGSAALNLASVRNSRIYNNLIHSNYSQGIAGWDDEAGEKYGCKDNLIVNNTVVMPPHSRHTLSLRHGSTGNVVKNNILLHLGGKGSLSVDESSLMGLDSDYNGISNMVNAHYGMQSLRQWQNLTKQDKNSIVISSGEAIFSALTSNDYSLRPDSAVVDRGVPQTSVETDIVGVPRPQGLNFDIGAYEYRASHQ